MSKFRLYLLNAFCSALIGAVVECAGVYLTQQSHVDFNNLLKSLLVGAVIGTVALFFFFNVFLRLKKQPFFGFLSVFIVVAVLSFLGDLWYGLDHLIRFIHNKWIIVLVISEGLGLSLAWVWHRQILLFDEKLEQKKASNRERK